MTPLGALLGRRAKIDLRGQAPRGEGALEDRSAWPANSRGVLWFGKGRPGVVNPGGGLGTGQRTRRTTEVRTVASVMAEPSCIHCLADVEDGARIGGGTRIWRFAHVRRGAEVGEQCVLGNGVFVDTDVKIGRGVKIQNGVSVYAGVTIEDEAFLGPHMTFTNDLHPRSFNEEWELIPTWVGRGASIGANATVLCGVRIGEYSMVAAGAVVTHDVPPYGLVVGAPRLVGYVCRCGRKAVPLPIPYDYWGDERRCRCGRPIRVDETGEYIPATS